MTFDRVPIFVYTIFMYDMPTSVAVQRLWEIAVSTAERILKEAPRCGEWHDQFNRCQLPVGHAGEHHDGDRIRWRSDPGAAIKEPMWSPK